MTAAHDPTDTWCRFHEDWFVVNVNAACGPCAARRTQNYVHNVYSPHSTSGGSAGNWGGSAKRLCRCDGPAHPYDPSWCPLDGPLAGPL